MRKNKKLLLGIAVSAVLSAGTHAAWAQVVVEGSVAQVSPAPTVEEPVFSVLSDKIHNINGRLNSSASEHYYGFTSLRGQDVLLDSTSRQHIKVERHVDGAWTLISGRNTLKGLKPGEEIILRVTHNQSTPFGGGEYSLVFGSYPVLKEFKFHDEEAVLRIPYGYAYPEWLPTQAYKQARIEVQFTDTSGAPLEGAIAAFGVSFDDGYRADISSALFSNSQGKASRLVEFGRCEGGAQARDFVEYSRGYNNTWRSYYRTGSYVVMNYLVDVVANPEGYNLAHICRQQLVSSRPS